LKHPSRFLAIGAALLLAAALLPIPAVGAAGDLAAPYQDGVVLVGFKAGTSSTDIAAAARSVGGTDARTLGAGTHHFQVRGGSVGNAIATLKQRASVRYAEPNYLLHTSLVPNDASYGQLWAMHNTGQVVNGTAGTPGADIRAEPAWTQTTGSPTVVVGDVDTGIDYTHPDLAANVWSNPGGIGGCAAGTHGYNAITASCDPMDDNNHGSHTAGTIGAVGNNGIGVAGVNWTTQIMGLKFLDASGSGTTANAITAIDFAVQAKIAGINLRALNNSWGGGGFSQALLDEINKAGANGILFVVAAGNSAVNVDQSSRTAHYPCSYGAATEVCVAATDQNDSLASFSNYGPVSVHLGAPGTNILSTVIGASYAYFDGTSMATPHVTGAAALLLSAPGQGALTVSQVKSAILNSVDPDPALAGLTVTGGRLNLCKLIPGCGTPPPPPPSNLTFTSAAQTLPAGSASGPISVQVQPAASVAVTAGLRSSSARGSFALSASGPWTATSVSIPAGGTGTFYYQDCQAGSPTLTVSASGYGNGNQTETVNAGPLATLSVSPASVTLAPGGSQVFTAGGSDACGNAVSLAGAALSWSTTAPGTLSATSGTSTTFTATAAGSGSVTVSGGSGVTPGSASVSVVALSAPTNLVAGQQGKHLNLSWTASAGAVAYNLYRGTASGGEVLYVTGLTGTSVSDFSVVSGTTYFYQVTAVSSTGAESGRSNEASATAK
jgi:hypothetical protein